MTRPESRTASPSTTCTMSRTSAVCGSRTLPPSGPRALPLLSLLAFGFALLLGGCKIQHHSGGVSSAPADPGAQPSVAIFLDPEVLNAKTTGSPTFPITGRVVDLDGLGLPTELAYYGGLSTGVTGVVCADDGCGSGPGSGVIPIGPDGVFDGAIELAYGTNSVELSIPGTTIVETVKVVYNPGYTFGGALTLSEDVVYVSDGSASDLAFVDGSCSEPMLVSVTIALTDPETMSDGVSLVRVDEVGSESSIAFMTDNGDLQNGDEIEGDKIYSALVEFCEFATGEFTLKVVVHRSSGTIATSEEVPVIIVERKEESVLEELIALQNSLQSQLEAAHANGTVAQAIASIEAQLSADPRVAEVGRNDANDGVWVVYEAGIAGVIQKPAAGIKGGSTPRLATAPTGDPRESSGRLVGWGAYDSFHVQPSTGAVGFVEEEEVAAGSNTVESTRVRLIAAQFFDWGEDDDVPMMYSMFTEQGCYGVEFVGYLSEGQGSVEDFKNLGDYGVVAISSHGDTVYRGVSPESADRFGWSGSFGQVVVHSNMEATAELCREYESDLQRGRLVLWGGSFGMMPTFFSKYTGSCPNSLVYMSICRGTYNATLAAAFLGQGAGAFLGYSDYVAVGFCVANGPPVIAAMLEPGQTLAEAFIPGIVEADDSPAEFRGFGSLDLSIEHEGLLDASYESGQLSHNFAIEGDARIIPALGATLPTDGNYMGIVSTGLGYTTDSGRMTQEFCLDDDAGTIAFDWNFFSEEYMEWVGSQFQDSFTVTLTEADDPTNTVVLFHEFVDSLAGIVSSVEIGFDKGDVYATGWYTELATIPAGFAGKRVRLEFHATDVGDSAWDTAVLIDHIEVLPIQN
ncbi:MAG: choice-of-anchor L domain-containing protein [Planctomycetota bacterium]